MKKINTNIIFLILYLNLIVNFNFKIKGTKFIVKIELFYFLYKFIFFLH